MRTMTVKGLRTLLKAYPDETPVISLWEGIEAPIIAKNFKLQEIEGIEFLVIDVEEYGRFLL